MSTGKHDRDLRFEKTAHVSAFLAFIVAITLSTLCRAETSRSQALDKDEMGYPTNSAAAREMGMAEARRDVINGVMIVKTAGLPLPDRQDNAGLLKARCNASLQPIAGCIVSSGLMAYMSGYNEVSMAAIKQRFGTNIFDKLDQEAKARFEKRFGDAASRDTPATRQTYLVKTGDTLLRIARDHGVRLKDLSQANPGVEPTRLQVNQKLVIPAKGHP